MTPHQKAIEAAKRDAREAVDALIDAIGRIMLATLEQHQAASTPPDQERPPSVQSAPHSLWTEEEERLIREHYPTGGYKATQEAGVRRSQDAIQERAGILGVRVKRRSHYNAWTGHEDDLLRQHYPLGGVDGVQAAGVKRSQSAISGRAHILGVKRDFRAAPKKVNAAPPKPPAKRAPTKLPTPPAAIAPDPLERVVPIGARCPKHPTNTVGPYGCPGCNAGNRWAAGQRRVTARPRIGGES